MLVIHTHACLPVDLLITRYLLTGVLTGYQQVCVGYQQGMGDYGN